MNLSQGGHLTHGSPVNISGTYYDFVDYGVDKETEIIDYDVVREIALREKPKLIVAGASAYPRSIDFKKIQGNSGGSRSLFNGGYGTYCRFSSSWITSKPRTIC